MSDEPEFEAGIEAGRMWRKLAEQIAAAVPDILIADQTPIRALVWATCADACYWQSAGEMDSKTVNDLLKDYTEKSPRPEHYTQ